MVLKTDIVLLFRYINDTILCRLLATIMEDSFPTKAGEAETQLS